MTRRTYTCHTSRCASRRFQKAVEHHQQCCKCATCPRALFPATAEGGGEKENIRHLPHGAFIAERAALERRSFWGESSCLPCERLTGVACGCQAGVGGNQPTGPANAQIGRPRAFALSRESCDVSHGHSAPSPTLCECSETNLRRARFNS